MQYRTKFLGTKSLIEQYREDLDFIDKSCFPDDVIYDKIKGEPYSKRGHHLWWLTYDVALGSPIAFGGLKVYARTWNVYFCRAGVLSKYRGQGIHSQLLNKRLEWCKKNRIQYAYTYTSNENYSSVNNLTKYGFKLCDPWFSCSDYTSFFSLYKKIN